MNVLAEDGYTNADKLCALLTPPEVMRTALGMARTAISSSKAAHIYLPIVFIKILSLSPERYCVSLTQIKRDLFWL